MKFVRYFSRKLAFLAISLFFVATLTFFLMHTIPGDPFIQEQAVPEEIMKSMYTHYGLDQPWYIQYVKYLKGLVTFDLGPSFKYEGRTVNDIIYDGFPVSFSLGLLALFISVTCGIFLGSIASIYQSRWQDHAAMILAVIGMSIPSFILATLLQYLLAMKLPLFPIARWGGLSHAVLPSLALSSLPTAFIARLTRTNMIETLQQDYVLTAKAKGCSTFQVMRRHVFKNSLLPVVSYIGPLSAAIISGSFIVEKIFGIPGLGGWFVTSISNRDYTVIMGLTMFYSALLMFAIFIIDLIYFWLDPRIKGEYLK
ncbi:MAG: ABC transporter permease [Simkaniaceae bacterium]|nr:ABC transporter permease [Simkaniaceae bacterium]